MNPNPFGPGFTPIHYTYKLLLKAKPECMRSVFTMGRDWKSEKARKLGLSLEDRRKEYWCGTKYVSIDTIPTWKLDLLYATKSNKDKFGPGVDQKEQLQKRLRDNFEMKDGLDLTEKISIFVGDITQLEIDAIVNAANNSLLGGGGVDGAIHRAAGRMLLEENKTLGGCQNGEAKLSGGYNLPAKYVISTVGPRGEKPNILEKAYSNCLNLLLENNLRTIAFPCISTGVYGYPNQNAAEVALKTARTFLESHHQDIDRVIFCLFLPVDVEIYNQVLPIIFPSPQQTEKKESQEEKESN